MTPTSICNGALTYLSFLAVGTSCGWFVVNGLYNLVANEPKIANGGQTLGEINRNGSIASLVLCAFFSLYPFFCGKISNCVQKWSSTGLILLSLASLALLAVSWEVPAVVQLCGVLGTIVGNGSILLLFPLIATNYSGWLVAPLRAGTDLSSMISAFLAEAQSSNGVDKRYPTWLLFTFYTAISCVGLLAWCMILKYKIGLRCISEDTVAKSEQSEEERDVEAVSTVPSLSNKSLQEFSNSNAHGSKGITELIQVSLQSFACPRELLWPVVMATVTQITQWSILGTIGEIGAEMCDAQSCSGTSGRFVFRLSLTLSQVLVPGGSLLSSLGTCPRSIFYLLCILQYLSCFAVCAATGGLWRSFWSSEAGQALFISSYALSGMLEGYVITMTYRYIGDAESIPLAKRHSAGALLGIATVILVATFAFSLGVAVSDGQIACTDP
eukprot:symbB.v1.2.023975.t1/scaffold2236.1/size84961/9